MEVTYKTARNLTVSISGIRLGLVSSLTERMERELLPVKVMGRNSPLQYRHGCITFAVKLKRLIPELTDDVLQSLLNKEKFTFSYTDGTRTILYTQCELTSLTLVHEAGESRVEELELLALTRTMG